MFWTDPEVQEFTPEDKLFYLYLLTNPYSRQCGVSEITKKRMAFDLGFSLDTIDTLLIRFESYGKIKYNKDTNEVAIKNWRKYNPDTSPTVKRCIISELSVIKDASLVVYIYGTNTPYLQGEGEREEEREREGEEKNPIPPLSFEQLKSYVRQHCAENSKFSGLDVDDISTKLSHVIKRQEFKTAKGKKITNWGSYIFGLLNFEIDGYSK